MKLLALCDSPTVQTGFGRVASELMHRWIWENQANEGQESFRQIDVWGVNYHGTPHNLPFRIWPAGGVGWNDPKRLAGFLNLLGSDDYTHVWLMNDLWALSAGGFPGYLKKICDQRGIVSSLYFPVDAPVERDWCKIIEAVDFPFAYTEYGRNEVSKYVKDKEIFIVPHGVSSIYRPLGNKGALRQRLFNNGFVKPSDFLILNSNMNQKRKDILRSLQIVAELRQREQPFKLLLNMSEESADGTHLEQLAAQIGLVKGEDYEHMDRYFDRGLPQITEEGLNELYNAADLYLNTSLGEGWGLGMTEALAAGCPVAVPDHTSCREIARKLGELGVNYGIATLPLDQFGVAVAKDLSRVRYPVDVIKSADQIGNELLLSRIHGFAGLTDAAKQWMNWDRIAAQFMAVMTREKPATSSTLYMEMGGGLGDVFHQFIERGYYQALDELRPGHKAKVVLVCHNPAAKEIFAHHPKRAQIEVIDLPYWRPEEDKKMRALNGLPGHAPRLLPPIKKAPVIFYPHPGDAQIFDQIGTSRFVMFAVSAGMAGRSFPPEIAASCVRAVFAESFKVVWTGRRYERNAGNDQSHIELLPPIEISEDPLMINALNCLSAPGTAALLSADNCAGLVTCHSALSLLGWHFAQPMLLLYPESAYEEHIKPRDQWAFGIDRASTVHGLFKDFNQEMLGKFLDLL